MNVSELNLNPFLILALGASGVWIFIPVVIVMVLFTKQVVKVVDPAPMLPGTPTPKIWINYFFR